MFEAHASDDVGELDVDTEVIGIELELVALAQATFGIDCHRHAGDGAVVSDLPMAVAFGFDLEVHRGFRRSGRLLHTD